MTELLDDIQTRKIDIVTGINDEPSTTGQPNHPNDSLLCKNYNDLIDNELTSLINRVVDNEDRLEDVEASLQQSLGNSSPFTIPSFAGNVPNDAELYYLLFNPNFPTILQSFTYEKPTGATWEALRVMQEQYNIDGIDGVQQTVGTVNFTATRSGDNLEFLEINVGMDNVSNTFLILPIYLEIDMNTPRGFVTKKILILTLNLQRVAQNLYGWDSVGSPSGGS